MPSESPGKFSISNGMRPMGDQPGAIRELAGGLREGLKHQTLLGVTGSGKTFTMAGIVEEVQRPALVIAHNKTLAAQLATEFREIFPNNAVEYFVSYYDYYQPESYIPRTDTYIDKEADINEEIQRLRLSATKSLMTRRDVLIVASVSCIYGLGSPEQYRRTMLELKAGMDMGLLKTTRRLTAMHYERSNLDVATGKFRVRGDTLEIIPSEEETIIRVQFWGDEVEELAEVDPITGEVLAKMDSVTIFPAKHFVLPQEDVDAGLADIEVELELRLNELRAGNRLLESQRLEQRTRYDLELLREVGTCLGVENYSRHLGRRAPGSAPWTLLDYFPDDYLVLIDESHITLPQIRAMQKGDYSRKSTLVEYGFRLPSAIDNRPLKFEEFEDRVGQIVYVSATPGPYEKEKQQRKAEQIIRPTGLVDPRVIVKPTEGQIDDLLLNIRERIARHERVLVTTLTKRMAEQLSEHLAELDIKVHHLHSEVHTLERTEILRNLRLGIYDVVVGINLLREGLDLPEVSMVAILDADKEGYLRSDTSLIQTIGRAARHLNGTVIMYADRVTDSMRHAIDETERRRKIQSEYNKREGIEPRSIVKEVKDITDRVKELAGAEADGADMVGEERVEYNLAKLGKSGSARLLRDLEKQMRQAAKDLKFEKAAMLRDQIKEVRGVLAAMRETVGI